MTEREDGFSSPARVRKNQTNKIERVIQKYGLDDLGDDLERRWLGEGRDRQSLRDLAEYFNKRVLKEAMVDVGKEPLQGEVDNFYQILTGNQVTDGMRTQAESSLKQDGIDVDDVLDDFVSHQTIHTYLRSHRGVDRATPDDDVQVEKSLTSIRQLMSRLEAVTANHVQSMKSTGRLEIEDFDVVTNTQIICGDCGRQYQLGELFESGGCECMIQEDGSTLQN